MCEIKIRNNYEDPAVIRQDVFCEKGHGASTGPVRQTVTDGSLLHGQEKK